jgi:hypothetical protein
MWNYLKSWVGPSTETPSEEIVGGISGIVAKYSELRDGEYVNVN